MPNDTFYLDQPLLEDALKTPYFFNGRLLTQEDLTQEQAAQRTHRQHLGRALGSGVAYGLEVVRNQAASSAGDVVFDVSAGLALAQNGDTLHLPELVRLHFSVEPGAIIETATTGADDFVDCAPVTSTVSVTQTGLYLLCLGPATGREGLAAVSGLGNEAAPCNTKYRTLGVSFRALPLGTSAVMPSDRFRSAVALECFGFFDAALAAAQGDPIAAPSPGYGKVDALRASGALSACEVPLAVVHLNDRGEFDFVETWSVRRPLLRPALSPRWPLGGSDDRRRAEGEAAMLCFQDQIATLLSEGGSLASLQAGSRFSFLPGGGFLPVGGSRFDAATFLGPTATAVVDADFGRLRWLVEESWRCDALDLTTALPPITYFVFSRAAGQWVFFLRRQTDIVAIDSAEEPEVAPEVAAEKRAKLIVAVSNKWLGKRGDPTLSLTPGLREVEFLELDGKAAQKLAVANDVFERPSKLPVAARYFLAAGLAPGRYRLAVSAGGGKKFSHIVALAAGAALTLLVD